MRKAIPVSVILAKVRPRDAMGKRSRPGLLPHGLVISTRTTTFLWWTSRRDS